MCLFQETGYRVLNHDMPMYFPCTCRCVSELLCHQWTNVLFCFDCVPLLCWLKIVTDIESRYTKISFVIFAFAFHSLMYSVTNDWHLKLCCCSSDQLAARHFLTYIFLHLSAYLLPRDHSHHLLLLHPFTPGRKPIFSTNSSHYRFFISPDCVHELLDHFQIFVLIGLPVWFFLLIFLFGSMQ